MNLGRLATKGELIKFLDKEVLLPAENHPNADEIIRSKVRATRMRLDLLQTQEQVENISRESLNLSGN